MRKRKNKESIGNKSRTTYYEKNPKKIAAKKIGNCSSRNKTKKKNKSKGRN